MFSETGLTMRQELKPDGKSEDFSAIPATRIHQMRSNSETAILVENLSKIYKLYKNKNSRLKEALHPLRRKFHEEFYALKNVSFAVKTGEILGVMGKNGSGKSTLLKLIGGVIQQSSGRVVVNGNISALLELGAGFNPEFTGLENVFFYGAIVGFSRDQMTARLDSILDFADIGGFIHQPIKRYSSGMKARLAFAVAIHVDPDILIIDEVLSVGDEFFRRKCFSKIEQFIKEKKTILFVSHGPTTINELCHRAILLDRGELILDGLPKMVTMQYHRLIFAKPEHAKDTRDEILRLNGDSRLKAEIISEPDAESPNAKAKQIREGDKNSSYKAYYLPDMKPKSRVVYKKYGVEIEDVRIETSEGLRVNVLVPEEMYYYCYRVKFDAPARHVSFGMQIKTQKGLCITGLSSKEMAGVMSEVQKGEVFDIRWRFNCKLLQGTYFTNAGVSSEIDGKLLFLNRIEDAAAFKVQKNEHIHCGGLVNLDQQVQIKKFRGHDAISV